MKEAGHDIRTLFLCGGLSKNPLFVQIHANATGIKTLIADYHSPNMLNDILAKETVPAQI